MKFLLSLVCISITTGYFKYDLENLSTLPDLEAVPDVRDLEAATDVVMNKENLTGIPYRGYEMNTTDLRNAITVSEMGDSEGFLKLQAVNCECTYHPGGCIISKAAPAGFKCKCSYIGAWMCSGVAFPCVREEKCPGNLADHCACRLGGGDCGGYREPLGSCKNSDLPRVGVNGTAECSCGYHPGGCTIYSPAPYGWRCVCSYIFLWTCTGWPQQCAANEVCLGDDYTYCSCHNGGGDCGGYPDKPDCSSPFVSNTCNCDQASDWRRVLYTIEQVNYNTSNISIDSRKPITLTEEDVPNCTDESQSITFSVQESLKRTSDYSHESGIQIDKGVTFSAGIPIFQGIGSHVSISESYFQTWGESLSIETTYTGTFTCNGGPQKYTKCTVSMDKAKVFVPYVMLIKHKVIPNCSCESYGVWDGLQAYNARLVSVSVDNCTGNVSMNKTESLYFPSMNEIGPLYFP